MDWSFVDFAFFSINELEIGFFVAYDLLVFCSFHTVCIEIILCNQIIHMRRLPTTSSCMRALHQILGCNEFINSVHQIFFWGAVGGGRVPIC